MSTTIQVYPTISDFPFVEQTRARTEELFQELLDRYRVGSTIEVKAFYPAKSAEDEIRYVDKHVAWAPDMEVGFSYWINGEWDSSSWPSCLPVDDADRISEEDLVYLFHSKPEHLGQWAIVEELEGVLPSEKLSKVLAQDHYWSEYRNFAGPAIASIGYGLVAAALAEATDGVIASIDSAFEIEHNGESAAEFLAWWGDEQISFYGTDGFKGVGGI